MRDQILRGVGAVVLLAASSWAVWSRFVSTTSSTDSAARTAAEPSASPADIRQQEILRESIGNPGDPELGSMYETINVRHFGGALPAMPVVWERRLEEVGALAGRTFTLEGMFGRVGERTVILIHPKLRSDGPGLERALCHEMVHAYLYVTGDTSTDHGPAFQAVLSRLADAGAFAGLAASPEEREGLRAWLDAESARLDEERQAMERIGQELEAERAEVERDAVAARRDAYNARAGLANARADRYRAAVEAFNRQVERYNLMTAYPDGQPELHLRKQ
jgi:hypothetical protein